MRMKRTLVFACTTAVCLVTACTEEPPTEPVPDFAGTWSLAAVDNQPIPRTIGTLIDGSVRSVTAGQIIVRSRRRLDDTKRIVLRRGTVVSEDFVDTLTSPFDATSNTVYVRRFGLLASDDWVDTGTVNGPVLHLRVRYLEPIHRTVQRVTLTYIREP
ncbi:MAG: hypothetical protein IBJ03_16210 [Gemmatimonadaceae bacterium]|nr:hypothetical protein [Gemmatimonadaceae bacterium]